MASYINVDAWVDYVILNELARNVDAYIGSTYLVKRSLRSGGKLEPGPIWDHNLAYGNSDYCGGVSVEGLAVEDGEICDGRLSPIIFADVWRDPTFRTKVADRYASLREYKLGSQLINRIDSLEMEVRTMATNNFTRWPIANMYVWPNAYVGETWQEDVSFLRQWVIDRLGHLLLQQQVEDGQRVISFQISDPHIFALVFEDVHGLRAVHLAPY